MKKLSHRLYTSFLLPTSILVLLFVLAACGGSGSGSSATPTPTTGSANATATPTTYTATTPTITITVTGSGTACTLVTAAQAGQILGGTVQTQPTSITIGSTKADACGYKSSQGIDASLSVVVAADTTTAHTTFTQLQQATQSSAGSAYQVVSGLGDSAFTNGKILYVLKGKSVMLVTVLSTDATKNVSEEKQFAQDALPKLS